jgi:outer membrane lipoprotein SlyB
MENNQNIVEREQDGNSRHALTPGFLLKDSGRAVGVGAVTGAIAGAVAGAVAGAAAWSIWIVGREAVKAIRERARL